MNHLNKYNDQQIEDIKIRQIQILNSKTKKNISNDELKDLILNVLEEIKFEIDKLK